MAGSDTTAITLSAVSIALHQRRVMIDVSRSSTISCWARNVWQLSVQNSTKLNIRTRLPGRRPKQCHIFKLVSKKAFGSTQSWRCLLSESFPMEDLRFPGLTFLQVQLLDAAHTSWLAMRGCFLIRTHFDQSVGSKLVTSILR